MEEQNCFWNEWGKIVYQVFDLKDYSTSAGYNCIMHNICIKGKILNQKNIFKKQIPRNAGKKKKKNLKNSFGTF